MQKIIFITRHDPTKIGGGSFATRAYLEAFNKQYPNIVSLFVADSYENGVLTYESAEIIKTKPRSTVNAILGLLLGKLTRFNKVIYNWLKNYKGPIDMVIFDGSIISGTYINLFKKRECKLVTIHHNFEIEYHRENRSIETIRGNFFFWIKKFEKKAYLNSDINLFLTQPDVKLFNKFYGRTKAVNKVIGCFEYPTNKNKLLNLEQVPKNNNIDNKIHIVISGSLVTHQTVDGVEWFLNDIYPTLKNKYPGIYLTITGRSPRKALIEHCKKLDVNLVASPKNIRKIIEKGTIYCCPTRLGGGLKLRIMDALALGLPCIVHQKSYRGYETIGASNWVTTFTNKNDFLPKFESLLYEVKNNKDVKKLLIQKYNDEFSFEAGVERLSKIINYF